jgi:hypothetical protein
VRYNGKTLLIVFFRKGELFASTMPPNFSFFRSYLLKDFQKTTALLCVFFLPMRTGEEPPFP